MEQFDRLQKQVDWMVRQLKCLNLCADCSDTGELIVIHNHQEGLQGGNTDERYHLDSKNYDYLVVSLPAILDQIQEDLAKATTPSFRDTTAVDPTTDNIITVPGMYVNSSNETAGKVLVQFNSAIADAISKFTIPAGEGTAITSINGTFTPDEYGNVEINNVITVNGIMVDNSNPTLPVIHEVRPLPTDFFASTNSKSGVSDPAFNYKTDTFRLFDISGYVPFTIYSQNEILRDGNDLFIVGIVDNGTTYPYFILGLYDCRIINNVLVARTTSNRILDVTQIGSDGFYVKFHGSEINRGYIYLSTRPDIGTYPTTVPTELVKLNKNNFYDYQKITFPSTTQYSGNTTDVISYMDKVYLFFARANNNGATFVEVDENMTYRVMFEMPAAAFPLGIRTDAPFIIYNDFLYFCTIDYTSTTLQRNTIGLAKYTLDGRLIGEVHGQSIGTSNTQTPTPHWMSAFNGKIIVHTATLNPGLWKLLRFDASTLLLEEHANLPQRVTDDNSIMSDGYIYLNGEGTDIGSLYVFYYKDFSTYSTELTGQYRSAGSIKDKYPKTRVKKALGDFTNDKQYITINDVPVEVIWLTALPGSGVLNTLYVITSGTNINKLYRWDGTAFQQVGGSSGGGGTWGTITGNIADQTDLATALAAKYGKTGSTVSINNIAVVSALPGTPDANTLYIIPENMVRGSVSVAASGTTTVSFPHGLGVAPTYVNVGAKSSNAGGIVYWDANTTNINVYYSVVPTGTLQYWVSYS